MRSLAERLEALKEAMASKIDAGSREVMERATRALVEEKRADDALGEGDRAPALRLSRPDGEEVGSEEYLARGPLVVTFFRGHW